MDQDKQQAVAHAVGLLGDQVPGAEQALSQLWDLAFEKGRVAALDELQDRFCVCTK